MADRWEYIRQSLGAQARGEEPRAVVSQRTLFGIPSSVEQQMAAFAAEASRELGRQGSEESQDGAGTLRERLVQAARDLGPRAQIGRGMRYFILAGRAAGYDIPAYPFDPKGELKDFLRDSGAADLPDFYQGMGIPRESYQQLQSHALLLLYGEEGGRPRGHLVRGAEFTDAARFIPLCESRVLELGDARCLQSIAAALGLPLEDEDEDVF